VLTTELCPLGKFILTAGGVQISSNLEVIGLELALLAGSLCCRYGEEVDYRPELLQSAAELEGTVWAE
jgi:hypothetical protein